MLNFIIYLFCPFLKLIYTFNYIINEFKLFRIYLMINTKNFISTF